MNPCESQSEGGTRSLWTGSTLPELSLHHVDIDQGMSWLQKICSTAVRSALFMPRMIPHRTTQMPWSKMRHQVNHTLTTKIGAACLGIPLNLISKSAAHCTWWSDPFLSHGTPWLRCLLQRSPHPVWFCSTHVDRRPLSNGAVVTPAKKTKLHDLLSTKQDAHMHNGERPSPRIPDLLCCQKENNIHPHTKKSKGKNHINQRTEQHKLKRWGTTSKKQWDRLEFYLTFHIMSAFSRSHLSTSASEKLGKWVRKAGCSWLLKVYRYTGVSTGMPTPPKKI